MRAFVNIREAKARHIKALHTLFVRYGHAAPEHPWPGKVERYASKQATREAGITAEIVNGEMYDRLLGATRPPVNTNADLVQIPKLFSYRII